MDAITTTPARGSASTAIYDLLAQFEGVHEALRKDPSVRLTDFSAANISLILASHALRTAAALVKPHELVITTATTEVQP